MDFEKAIDLGSESPKIYNGLGMAYHLLGDREEALSNLNKALDKEGASVDFLIDRAKIYLDMAMYDASYEDLTKALEHKADDPQLYYKRGIVLFSSGNYDEAIEDLKMSISNNPFPTYESDIYYHIGIAHARKEEYEESVEPLSKCIEMCPNEAIYYHERAKSY
jgi:tetratricopeptide (TPR) repeat protein